MYCIIKPSVYVGYVCLRKVACNCISLISYMPGVVVVEIPESGIFRFAEKCLAICDAIRKQVPGCKQVLICSESDADSCRAAIQAKQENRIDDFLFYDTSVNYLFSKLESLFQ